MHIFHYLSAGINIVNILITLLLLTIYLRNYRHIKSGYNLGLLIFSLLFLAENIVILHLGIFSWPTILADTALLHMILIDAIEMVGLLAVLLVTWD
jgi:hypothetical protein